MLRYRPQELQRAWDRAHGWGPYAANQHPRRSQQLGSASMNSLGGRLCSPPASSGNAPAMWSWRAGRAPFLPAAAWPSRGLGGSHLPAPQPALPAGQQQRRSRRQPWHGGGGLLRRAARPQRPSAAAENLAGSGGSELSLDGGVESVGAGVQSMQSRAAALGAGLKALLKFTRPHTMLGTFISVCSISLLALGPGDFGSSALSAFLQAVTSALLMNVCIVGINQIYDIEIDRVNKPYLPLAAGDFSVRTGVAIVVATGAAALAVGLWSGSAPLLATLCGSLALGIAYSTDLPFLRWKRWPLVAAGCILAVRAVLVQLGFYLHMRGAVGGGGGAVGLASLSRPVLFATAFMLVFSIVIALFKDIPDVAGDSKAGVRTLSVRLGVPRVFWTCIGLLEAAYLGAIIVGLGSQSAALRAASVGAHAVMGAVLMWRARRTDLTSSASIYEFYINTVWVLFYLEYFLLPLFRF